MQFHIAGRPHWKQSHDMAVLGKDRCCSQGATGAAQRRQSMLYSNSTKKTPSTLPTKCPCHRDPSHLEMAPTYRLLPCSSSQLYMGTSAFSLVLSVLCIGIGALPTSVQSTKQRFSNSHCITTCGSACGLSEGSRLGGLSMVADHLPLSTCSWPSGPSSVPTGPSDLL